MLEYFWNWNVKVDSGTIKIHYIAEWEDEKRDFQTRLMHATPRKSSLVYELLHFRYFNLSIRFLVPMLPFHFQTEDDAFSLLFIFHATTKDKHRLHLSMSQVYYWRDVHFFASRNCRLFCDFVNVERDKRQRLSQKMSISCFFLLRLPPNEPLLR